MSVDEALLRLYYERLFPATQMVDWLNYGDQNLLPLREFSFTIAGDIYIRYLSFSNKSELMKEIKRKLPHKIDIGAVYNIQPKKHNSVKSTSFLPKQRELVFDIDLTDYEPVQNGKKEVQSMWDNRSWGYMSVAMKIVTKVLRDDFGYNNLFWVFSGRRGVHCWVCDEKARLLTDGQRSAVIKYLTVIVGNKIDARFPLHPGFERFMPMLHEAFQEICLSEKGQEILDDEQNFNKVLQFISDVDLAAKLRAAWSSEADMDVDESMSLSQHRWNQLKATILDAAAKKYKKSLLKESAELKNCIDKIVLFYVFPRLDVNVSTHRNHLLKSPFVVHPKTGKVCVPILDVESCEDFDPDEVPTLSTLAEELNNLKDHEDTLGDIGTDEQWKRTSMRKYIEEFESKFLQRIRRENEVVSESHKKKPKFHNISQESTAAIDVSW